MRPPLLVVKTIRAELGTQPVGARGSCRRKHEGHPKLRAELEAAFGLEGVATGRAAESLW
ncbi:MAG: hypothetical protein Q7T82_13385 [Armatimonadota bacterium]|nr:hypothetical protein [Armatimonadota bacterium]